MEAPEKIMIGKSNITSDGDVVFSWVTYEPDCEAMQHNIEYIRADAFIKKACEWISDNCYIPNATLKDFRNAMKGE